MRKLFLSLSLFLPISLFALSYESGDGGSGGITVGETVTGGTAGSVLFIGSGPTIDEDNSNLFWDDTNNNLGIGTTAPVSKLEVNGAIIASSITVRGSVSGFAILSSTEPNMNFLMGVSSPVVINTSSVTIAGDAYITAEVGIGISNPTYPLDITDDFTAGAGLARAININTSALNLSSDQVYFGVYSHAIHTGTTDNTANAAHFGGGVVRASDTWMNRTDGFGGEARYDARSNQSGQISTGFLAYIDAVSTATSSANYDALTVRGCISTDGDCGTDALTGNRLRGVYIENLQGNAYGTNHSIYQEGPDDLNYFAGKIGVGSLGTVPTDHIGVAAISTCAISMLTTLPTMQSRWGHDGVSSMTYIGATTGHALSFRTTSTERLRVTTDRALLFATGTSTPSAVANFAGFYAVDGLGASAEMYSIDEAGNLTLQSPHNEEGEWVFKSCNQKTARCVDVNMEKFFKYFDEKNGTNFFNETKQLE